MRWHCQCGMWRDIARTSRALPASASWPTIAGEQVAIFCHGGIIRMVLSILLRWPLSSMAMFEIEYASLTQVALLPHKAKLQLLNFAPWREMAS